MLFCILRPLNLRVSPPGIHAGSLLGRARSSVNASTCADAHGQAARAEADGLAWIAAALAHAQCALTMPATLRAGATRRIAAMQMAMGRAEPGAADERGCEVPCEEHAHPEEFRMFWHVVANSAKASAQSCS